MDRLEKRKEIFNHIVEDIEKTGYVMKHNKIDLMKMNIFSLILMIIYGSIVFSIQIFFHGLTIDFTFQNYILFLMGLMVSIIVHEGIHALTAHIVSKVPFHQIEFGIMKGNPYCYVCAKVTKKQYLFFVLMPTIVLGIGMSIIGLLMSNFWVLLLAILNFASGAGDICVAYQLVNQECEFVIDHPTDVGYVYFEKKEVF